MLLQPGWGGLRVCILANSGLTVAAFPRTTLWVMRVCQTLTQAQVSAASSWRLTPQLPLPHPLRPVRFFASQLQARIACQAHLNCYYLFFPQNLTRVTIPKHFPKIESYYIHCFPFYLFIWHFYRLQKKAVKFVWHDLYHINACYLLLASLSANTCKEFL